MRSQCNISLLTKSLSVTKRISFSYLLIRDLLERELLIALKISLIYERIFAIYIHIKVKTTFTVKDFTSLKH